MFLWKSSILNLHFYSQNVENITMELVLFSIMGDCVCKIVCQFVGMGSIYFWVCVFLSWWLFISCLGLCGCWTLIFFSCDKYLY